MSDTENLPANRVIYRHHLATWLYRLLPVTVFAAPALLGSGTVPSPVAITALVLAIAAMIYGKFKLHGRIDTIQTTQDGIRVRKPGLVLSSWQTLPPAAFREAKLISSSVRNAAAAYRIEVPVNEGRDRLNVPMNGAAANLEALAEISPDAIAKFRAATANTRIHYDL